MLDIVKRADDELFSKSENEVAGEWWWKWDIPVGLFALLINSVLLTMYTT
jgi:hypothetical protein